MKLLSSLFSCVYSRVKLFVFAMSSRRRYYIFVGFIYGLEEKNWKSEVVFAVCMPSAVNVILNLSNKTQCSDLAAQIWPPAGWRGDWDGWGNFEELCDCLELPIPHGESKKKHFQVISLPGRRNEKQRREIWWRKIRSSLVRFSLFVLFCLFVFFALRNKKKIEEETRDCSSVYLIVRTTLQNGTALEGNDFDVPFWKRRIRLRFSFALYNAWEERCTKK